MGCSGVWDRLDALITLSCLIFSFIAGQTQGYLFNGRKPNPTEDIIFHIYNRHSSSSRPSRIFVNTSESLLRCEWVPAKPTKIITHGWQSRIAEGSAGINLKNTLLELVDVNVITVDWSHLYSLWYPSSKDSAAPVVAEEVSKLLKLLVAAGSKLEEMHLIGHSLGAHILGVAARDQVGTLGKITALDPAGPSFEDRRLIGYWRLSPNDAGFVEVVHTDAGRLGYEGSLGHVDFRPGGGKGPQKGCGRDFLGICSHCFSWEVYRHALSHPGELVGTLCHSWVDFNEGVCAGNFKLALSLDTDTTARGNFYLNIDHIEPKASLKLLGGSVLGFLGSAISSTKGIFDGNC